MVGDDLRADVAAAQGVGMRAILVLSGKTDAAAAERAARGTRGPDAIAATLADVVAALD
jgi:ribonucleotide monophosphatase NagD (HAD superfamily)